MRYKVATKSEIPAGAMKQVTVAGKIVLLANVGDSFFAIGDTCTHEHCSLSTGILDGSVVFCACHGGQFDVTTGVVVSPPPTEPEPTYKVLIEGEDIFVEA